VLTVAAPSDLDHLFEAGVRAFERGDLDELRSAVCELEAAAEHSDDRRGQGIFFTAPDVARYIVEATLAATIAGRLGGTELLERVHQTIAAGDDPIALVRETLAAEDPHRARTVVESIVVLDPTCGGGAFLLAGVDVLLELCADVGARVGPANVRGCDVRRSAVEACRRALALQLATPDRDPVAMLGQLEEVIVVADATRPLPLDRCANVIVGNPPYVRSQAGAGLRTRSTRNLVAFVVEQALACAEPGAHIGFVLPASTTSTAAFAPLREMWSEQLGRGWVSSYDTIPSTLFAGIVQRLSIVLGHLDPDRPCRWHVTGYRRWRANERAQLFDRVEYVTAPEIAPGAPIPRLGSSLEVGLFARIGSHPPAARWIIRSGDGANRFWYKRRWSYFLLFVDFMPAIYDADGTQREPTEFKVVDVTPGIDARVLLAIYNSSLFYWYFTACGDNRNVNRREIESFPIPDLDVAVQSELVIIADELMRTLRASSELRTCTYRSIGTIRNTYFRQGATKPVLDRIDACLARAYSLNPAQLEFITTFDAEYRGVSGTAAR
jgi:hypothetical protein